MHVQGSDLLQGHSSAEGSGGRAGQEVQAGGHTGHRGWSQRCQHDQRYQQQTALGVEVKDQYGSHPT